MNENQLEEQALEWFTEQGYNHQYGPDIAPDGDSPERRDYMQVILASCLLAALRRINTDVPVSVLEEVSSRLEKPEHLSLMTNNRHFHEQILDGVPVEI